MTSTAASEFNVEQGLMELPGTPARWIWAFTCPEPKCACRTAVVLSLAGERELLLELDRLRDLIYHTRDVELAVQLGVPRFTAKSWWFVVKTSGTFRSVRWRFTLSESGAYSRRRARGHGRSFGMGGFGRGSVSTRQSPQRGFAQLSPMSSGTWMSRSLGSLTERACTCTQ